MKLLKKLRKDEGLSKSEFLKEFNILYNTKLNRFTYTLIEEGFKQPSNQIISGLNDYYNISKDILKQNNEV